MAEDGRSGGLLGLVSWRRRRRCCRDGWSFGGHSFRSDARCGSRRRRWRWRPPAGSQPEVATADCLKRKCPPDAGGHFLFLCNLVCYVMGDCEDMALDVEVEER